MDCVILMTNDREFQINDGLKCFFADFLSYGCETSSRTNITMEQQDAANCVALVSSHVVAVFVASLSNQFPANSVEPQSATGAKRLHTLLAGQVISSQ